MVKPHEYRDPSDFAAFQKAARHTQSCDRERDLHRRQAEALEARVWSVRVPLPDCNDTPDEATLDVYELDAGEADGRSGHYPPDADADGFAELFYRRR